MIVKSTKSLYFFHLLCEMRGSVVPAILPKICASVVLGVFANLALLLDVFGENTDAMITLELGPFAALGVAISLFLGFHNNASYARWWEARTYWGGQVIVVRDLARFLLGTMNDDLQCNINYGVDMMKQSNTEQEGLEESSSSIDTDVDTCLQIDDIEASVNVNTACNRLVDIEDEEWSISNLIEKKTKRNDPKNDSYASWQAHIVYLGVAHSHAFRSQMRPTCHMDGMVSAAQDRDRFLNKQEQTLMTRSKNPANTILRVAANILGKSHRSKQIDTYSMIHVQKLLDIMCELQTGCERIQNTSLPLAYSLLVHRTTVLYVMLVPFAIAPSVGWWAPLFTAIVAYTFFGLDQVAKEIQEPMMDKPMCLALSAMCRTIEIDALEALGEETPGFLKPNNNNCLM